MLTDLLKPTSGRAFIYSNDIIDPSQLEQALRLISFCPQPQFLFNDFPVQEHLEFFARMRFSQLNAKSYLKNIINGISLQDQRHSLASQLSGGQKRRLSIGIAIIGNPKGLVLDGPSSGVDIHSELLLWDMIRGLRKGRSLIITIQSMNEADVLAGRKLIISHGKLRCAGTSLFLKNHFGSGYCLTVVIREECDAEMLTKLLTSFVPVVKRVIRSHGKELFHFIHNTS